MTKGLPIGLLMTSLLAACSTNSTTPPPDEAPRPPAMSESSEDDCGAGRVQSHVGHGYSETLERTIVTESEAQRVRTIRLGQSYTMDYRADRLNIHLDEDGRISELSCG